MRFLDGPGRAAVGSQRQELIRNKLSPSRSVVLVPLGRVLFVAQNLMMMMMMMIKF